MELLATLSFISIVLLIVGIYKFIKYKYAIKHFSVVEGYIKDKYKHVNKNGIAVYYPIVHYVVDGTLYKIMGWGKVVMDKPWNVFYNPNNPSNAVLEKEHGIAYIVFGLLFAILPIIAIFHLY